MGVIVFRLEGDEAGAVRAFLRLTKAQQEAELGAMKAAKAAREHRDTATSGAAAMAGELSKMAAGWLSVGTAVQVATAAVREYQAEKKKAAESAETSAMSYGKMAQLVQSPAELQAQIEEIKRSRQEVGMNAEQATSMQFALKSAGLDAYRSKFAKLHGMTDVGTLVSGANRMVSVFGSDRVNAMQATNMLFGASQQSATEVGQMAGAMGKVGEALKRIGGSPEEVLAALSVRGQGVNVEQVTTGILSLIEVIEKKGFAGRGLWGGNDAIAEATKDMSPTEIHTYFGRDEALIQFKQMMDQRAKIQERQKVIGALAREAPGEDYISRSVKAFESTPSLMGVRRMQAAKQAEELATEDRYSIQEMRNQERLAREKERAARIDTGGTRFLRRIAQAVLPTSMMGTGDLADLERLMSGFKPREDSSLGRIRSLFGLSSKTELVASILSGNDRESNPWGTGTADPDRRYATWNFIPAPPYRYAPSDLELAFPTDRDVFGPADFGDLRKGDRPARIGQASPTVINNYGDNYYLGDRKNLTESDELGPVVGVE